MLLGVCALLSLLSLLLLLLQLTYVSFGVVWDLDLFRLLDPATEEALYLLAELASKVSRLVTQPIGGRPV